MGSGSDLEPRTGVWRGRVGHGEGASGSGGTQGNRVGHRGDGLCIMGKPRAGARRDTFTEKVKGLEGALLYGLLCDSLHEPQACVRGWSITLVFVEDHEGQVGCTRHGGM